MRVRVRMRVRMRVRAREDEEEAEAVRSGVPGGGRSPRACRPRGAEGCAVAIAEVRTGVL
eukprot:scaffold74830_cov39-Phaeocystis_antarctica.AAC.1